MIIIDIFLKILTASKQLTVKGLQQLLARAKGVCANGRKHVLESLPFIASSSSIELMKDLIVSKNFEVTKEIEETWMQSMFYLPRPEIEIVSTMKSLIQHFNNDRNPIFVLIPTAVISTCKKDKYLKICSVSITQRFFFSLQAPKYRVQKQ